MTNQFNTIIEAARKASNIARNEFFEKVPELFIRFDKQAVQQNIDRDLSRMAKRDEKTHEWDRFVKNKEKGLAASLKAKSVPFASQTDSEYIRSGANLFWDEIVDSYAAQYKGSEFIPYFSNDNEQFKNTPESFVDHAYNFLVDENYRLEGLQNAGYSSEQLQKVSTEFSQQIAPMYKQKGLPSKEALADFVFTNGTDHPMLTVLGTTQKDLRRQRLENMSRDLGVFKLSPLHTRDETQALNSQASLLEYKKLRDIEEPPTEYSYADVVADKWDSQIRYGQTGEIIRNSLIEEDQFSLGLPEDPSFSIYEHPEIEEWSNEIGNPEFVKRIAKSKSYAEAEALYFAAKDEVTRLGRIEQYYQQNKFSKAVQMLSPISYLADIRPDELALDIGIGMIGDPVGLLGGGLEGVGVTKALGQVVKGTTKKAIITRGLAEATFGGVEGALYMHLYGKHADPTRAPGNIVAGAILGGAIGGAFEFGIGESGAQLRNRIAANKYVKNLREIANTLESLSDKYDATPTIEQSNLQPMYGGIPFPADPFKRLRQLADDVEKAGKVTEQDVGITRDSIAQTEEILNRTIQSEAIDIDLVLPEEARPFIKELIDRGLTRTGNIVSDIFDENGNLITDLQGNPVNRYRIQIHEAEGWLIFTQALETVAAEGEDFLGKFLSSDIRFSFQYHRSAGGTEKRNRVTKESLTNILGITREDLDNFIEFMFLDEEGQMTMPGRDKRAGKSESEYDDLPTGVAKALLSSYAFTNLDSVVAMKAVMDLLNIDPVTYGQLVKDGFITRPGVLGLLDFNNEFEVYVNKKNKVNITRRKQALGIGVDELYGDFIRSQSEKEQGSKARVMDDEDVIIDPETGTIIINIKPTKKQVQENALKGIGQGDKKRKKRYFVDGTKVQLIDADLPEFVQANAVFFDYAAVAGIIAARNNTLGLAHLQALRMIMGDPRLARKARLDKAWRDEVKKALENDDEDFLLESQTRTVSTKLKEHFEDYATFTSIVLEEMQKDLDDRSIPLSLIYESTIATNILVDLLYSDGKAARLFGISEELDFVTMAGTLTGPALRHLVETLVTDFNYRLTKGDLELSEAEAKTLRNLDKRLKKNYRKKLAGFYSNSEVAAWEKGNNPNLMTAFDRLVRGKNFSQVDKTLLRKVQGKLQGYEEMRKLVAEILTTKPDSFFKRYGISEARLDSYDAKMKRMEAGGVTNFLGDPRIFADDIDGLNDWWQSYVYSAAILERRAKQGSLSVIKDVNRIVSAIKKQKKMILGSVQQVKQFETLLEKREKAYLLLQDGPDKEIVGKKIENIKTQISNIYTKYGVESLNDLESLLEIYDNFLFTFNLDVESLNKDEARRQSTEIVFQPHQLVSGLRKMSDSMKKLRKGLVSGINDKRRSTAASQALARIMDNFTYDLNLRLDPEAYTKQFVIAMKLRGIPDRILPDISDSGDLMLDMSRLLDFPAAGLGRGVKAWGVRGLDSNTNPFRGRNKVYSRTNLQNWLKDANNFIKGFTGFQDILEDIDLTKASNTELVTLAQDLIESLKILEAEEILDFTAKDLGDDIYSIVGEMRPGVRTAVYNLYTRFIGLSDNIGVPEGISALYTKQLTGRAKLIPLSMYIKNNFYMTLPQARYYLNMRAQNTPLRLMFALREQGVDPGRILDSLATSIVEKGRTLPEALKQRHFKISTLDKEATDALAVLALRVQEMVEFGKTAEDVAIFLGEVGPTGLPKKIEDIILPSTHRKAWKSFLEELKQLPKTIGIETALRSQSVFRGSDTTSWNTTTLYQELQSRKRDYDILVTNNRHTGPYGVQLKKIIEALEAEMKKISRLDRAAPFMNLAWAGIITLDANNKFVFADKSLEKWYDDSIKKAIDAFADVEDVFDRSKARFMRDINREELEEAKDFFGYFMEDFDKHLMAISETFQDVVDEVTTPEKTRDLSELIINQLKRASNNAHVLAGLPEPYPHLTVNVFRLDLMNQANFIFTVRDTMLNQNMMNKLQAFQDRMLADLEMQDRLEQAFAIPDANKLREISDKQIFFSNEFSRRLRTLHAEFQKGNALFGTMDDQKFRGFVENQKQLLDVRRGETEATKQTFIEKAVEDIKDRLDLPDNIFLEIQDELRLIVMESMEEFDKIVRFMEDDSFGMDPKTIYVDPKLTIQQETIRQQGLKLPRSRRRRPGGGRRRGAIMNPVEIFGALFDKIVYIMGRSSADFAAFTKKRIEEAFGRMEPGEKVAARDWIMTWGYDVLDPTIGKKARKVFNSLRSARARANANEAGMIRKLGQFVFGSELAIMGENGVFHSRAEGASDYESIRMGVVKYRTRVFGQFARNLETIRNERTFLAADLGLTEREFDGLTRAFYTLIREQIAMDAWKRVTGNIEPPNPEVIRAVIGRLPEKERDRIFRKYAGEITEIEENIKAATRQVNEQIDTVAAEVLRKLKEGTLTLEGFNLEMFTPEQGDAFIRHLLSMEKVKQGLKELLPEDSELRLSLDSKNLVNALDADSFRDLEHALEGGEIERIIGDSLEIQVASKEGGDPFKVIKSPIAKAVLGQIIYKKIKTGTRHVIYSAGTYNRLQLFDLMTEHFSLEDLKSLYPNVAELDGLSIDDVKRRVIQELFADDPEGTITLRLDRDKPHTAKVKEGFKGTYEYERLTDKNALGDKLNQNRLENFSINEITKADVIDELDNVGKRVIDSKVESDLVNQVNDDLGANNVVDEKGNSLQFDDVNELFRFFDNQIDELYKMGLLTNTEEPRLMLTYMKSLVTGRDPKHAMRNLNVAVKTLQKAATAMSTADFAIAAIPEIIGIALRTTGAKFMDAMSLQLAGIKDYTSDISVAEKKLNKIRKAIDKAESKGDTRRAAELRAEYEETRKTLDDLEMKQGFLEDIMSSAGVGTEGALYRNTGSNRRSIIFDSVNPMFNPTAAKPELGRVNKLGREVNKRLEDMATRAADGEALPGLGLVSKTAADVINKNVITKHAQKLSLNHITEVTQKLAFNSMASRLIKKMDKVSIDDLDLNNPIAVQALADEIIDPVLAAQLGLEAKDIVRMVIQVKAIIANNADFKTRRRGVDLFDLGSILNHGTFDPQLREKFQVALYNWVGQNIVRPDAGDLPYYVSDPFIGLLIQFRSFGMAQYHKTYAPAMQRVARSGWEEKAKSLGGAIGITTMMSALYALVNYYIYNKEEIDKDVEKFGGWMPYLEACFRNSMVGRVAGEEETYIKPETNALVPFAQGISDPFMGPVGVPLDVTYPALGLQDPFSWYDQNPYGGKYGMAEEIMRTSAAFRAGADVIDPARRAINNKEMDSEYWYKYTGKLSGRNKMFSIAKPMIFAEED